MRRFVKNSSQFQSLLSADKHKACHSLETEVVEREAVSLVGHHFFMHAPHLRWMDADRWQQRGGRNHLLEGLRRQHVVSTEQDVLVPDGEA